MDQGRTALELDLAQRKNRDSNPAYAGIDMLEGESIRARPTEVLWITPSMYLNNLLG